MHLQPIQVQPDTAAYQTLISAAEQLNQTRYIVETMQLIGAYADNVCVGFLRLLVQAIGSDAGRSPITHAGCTLTEGYVEAFGVLPAWRRRGIGQALQAHAIDICQRRGCYQIRSRSPITSYENYALKLKMGYAVHPSHENDSYYFIKTLV